MFGRDWRENRAKCRKMVIFPGLKQELSRLSLTHQKTLFYTFSDQIHPPQISKSTKKHLYFGQISNSSLIFTLSLSWGLVSNFITLPYPFIIEVTLAEISFSKLMPIQSYRGKTVTGLT